MSEECEKCKECDECQMVFVLCLQIFETSAIAGPRSTKGADNGPHLYNEKFGWPTAILFLAPAEGWKGPSGPAGDLWPHIK